MVCDIFDLGGGFGILLLYIGFAVSLLLFVICIIQISLAILMH